MTLPWETLARADTPDGPLELRRRGERDFMLTIRGRVLMTSAAHRSEDELARLAFGDLAGARGGGRPPHVLVGGLGLGFTLRAALDVLGKGARITVAELNPVVVEWCRGPLAELNRHALEDPRVTVATEDVARVIARAAMGPPAARFDAIAIDLYDGPQARVRPDDPLYGPAACANACAALRDGGAFAVWCEKHSPAFERALNAARFRVETHRSGRGGSVHLIYLGRAPRREPKPTKR